jgi:hypothetical protein
VIPPDFHIIVSSFPDAFIVVADQFGLAPERLLDAICFTFCSAPPKELVLIERAQAEPAANNSAPDPVESGT